MGRSMSNSVAKGVGSLFAAGALIAGGYYAGGGFEGKTSPVKTVEINAQKIAKSCGETAVQDVLNEGVDSSQTAGEMQRTAQTEVEKRMAECFDQYVTEVVAGALEDAGTPKVDVQMNLVAEEPKG